MSDILFCINTCREGVLKIPDYTTMLYILIWLSNYTLMVKRVLFHDVMKHWSVLWYRVQMGLGGFPLDSTVSFNLFITPMFLKDETQKPCCA